eukprot:gene20186-22161_t
MEANLDENYLFSSFQEQLTGKPSKSKKSKKRKLVDIISKDDGEFLNISGEIAALLEQKEKYIQQLEEQNNKLKAVIKRICGPQDLQNDEASMPHASFESMPMAVVLFLNNQCSLTYKNELETCLINLPKKDTKADDIGDNAQFAPKVQPSAVPLRAFSVDTKGKRIHKPKAVDESNEPHVCSSVQYYHGFCLDRTGLPLLDYNPAISQLWSIPVYEQVFLNALPVVTDGQKIVIRQKKQACCFNCLGDHNVSQCDQPKDQKKINSNRDVFMQKFGSPVADSRYHQSDTDRFRDFKPGHVSSGLREALGIDDSELPPYIYKMRLLGYPPGYLKPSEPSLLMYGKEGNRIDDLGQEEGELEFPPVSKNILYEGFNAPMSEGVIDRSIEYGMPPFDESYTFNSIQHDYSFQSPSASSQTNHYPNDSFGGREIVSRGLDKAAVDMELDDTAINSNINQSSADRYDFAQDGPDYTGVKSQLSQSTPEHSKLPLERDGAGMPLNSYEVGELFNEVEKTTKASEIIDTYLAQGQTSYHDDKASSTHREWWIDEPISSTAGILYYTCTPPPTIKAELKFENIVKDPVHDIDREPWKTDSASWYDPLYGDLSTHTGIYDSIKEILKKRKRRRQLKKVR